MNTEIIEEQKIELVVFKTNKNLFHVKIKDEYVGIIHIDDIYFGDRTAKVVREVFQWNVANVKKKYYNMEKQLRIIGVRVIVLIGN